MDGRGFWADTVYRSKANEEFMDADGVKIGEGRVDNTIQLYPEAIAALEMVGELFEVVVMAKQIFADKESTKR